MQGNILQTIKADRSLSAVGKGIKAAGLEPLLSKEGSFTVFAPIDIAFDRLGAGMWTDLLENKVKVTDFINNYVVKGKTCFKDFTDGQKLKTLGGKELSVTVSDGNVEIDGARIRQKDINASNGVVHSLDRVALFQLNT